jgi:hypothetical protein
MQLILLYQTQQILLLIGLEAFIMPKKPKQVVFAMSTISLFVFLSFLRTIHVCYTLTLTYIMEMGSNRHFSAPTAL